MLVFDGGCAQSAVPWNEGTMPCPDLSSFIVQVSVKVTADMDLADHLLSFLNAALSSPEAQHALPLRKAFVNELLDLGESVPYAQACRCRCSCCFALSSMPKGCREAQHGQLCCISECPSLAFSYI